MGGPGNTVNDESKRRRDKENRRMHSMKMNMKIYERERDRALINRPKKRHGRQRATRKIQSVTYGIPSMYIVGVHAFARVPTASIDGLSGSD